MVGCANVDVRRVVWAENTNVEFLFLSVVHWPGQKKNRNWHRQRELLQKSLPSSGSTNWETDFLLATAVAASTQTPEVLREEDLLCSEEQEDGGQSPCFPVHPPFGRGHGYGCWSAEHSKVNMPSVLG